MDRLIGALDNIAIGADGSFIGFSSVLFFLSRYPEMQERAREEIRCRGPEEYFDRRDLPYCSAFLAETQRFVCQAGLGGSHLTKEEMNYKGMDIPKNVGDL